jgi:histone H2A
MNAGAPVYMAATLEYLAAEMLEIAGYRARDNGRKNIKPRDILLSIETDEEFHALCKHSIVANGGVLPRIR